MRQILKQWVRIVVATIIATALLAALLHALQTRSPTQAASLESAAMDASLDVFPESGAYLGIVIPLEQLNTFECLVGKQHKVIKIYQHFHNDGFYQNFADLIHKRGAIEFLSFDPTIETGDLNCCEVLSRDYDSVIITFAQSIKRWGHPLILSFAGEMNGNWAGWSGAYNFGPDCVTYTQAANLYTAYGCTDTQRSECADGPERYRDMYRHVHDIFATEGVTNVVWAWVVNHESIPDLEWNQANNYYPGDAYVDAISVDGYNWGTSGPGGWKTFNQVFSAALTTLSSTHATKHLMLGEFASVEGTDPMSKANWITDAYSRIQSDWPQIKAAVWFDLPGEEGFSVASSPESLQAYREAIADPYFVGKRMCCVVYLPVILKP